MDDDKEFADAIKERFAKLPKVVQDAITSADVSKHLREMADSHKLHLDQWETLENEVQLTLLGIQQSEDLEKNIRESVGVSEEEARSLANDVAKIVFEPIREELERQLEHPEAKAEVLSGAESARRDILASRAENIPTPTPVPAPTSAPVPVIVPAAPALAPVVRAPVSENYKAGEPSTVRASVHDDPYREPPL